MDTEQVLDVAVIGYGPVGQLAERHTTSSWSTFRRRVPVVGCFGRDAGLHERDWGGGRRSPVAPTAARNI